MRKLEIPEPLKVEFATVEALWKSDAKTRRVDALLLSWIKYEKQLRRLFCFLVFQHPNIGKEEVDDTISVIAKNNNLYPDTFIACIKALGLTPVHDLLDDHGKTLFTQVERIEIYRNKLVHGQMTGMKLTSDSLERDVIFMVDWLSVLGEAARKEYGYDGIGRNAFRHAKEAETTAVQNYPFNSTAEFGDWLKNLSKDVRKAKSTGEKKQVTR